MALDGVICVRLTLVAVLLSIRGVTAYFMPELFIQSKVVAVQIDPAAFHPASDLIQVRVMLLLLVLAGYLYAVVAGRYFRFMAVVAMVVSECISVERYGALYALVGVRDNRRVFRIAWYASLSPSGFWF